MSRLLHRPVAELIAMMQAKELSSVELMRATLARISETRETLNAFVALRDEAELLADARAAEERIGAGNARPLEGIPLGVKDLEDA